MQAEVCDILGLTGHKFKLSDELLFSLPTGAAVSDGANRSATTTNPTTGFLCCALSAPTTIAQESNNVIKIFIVNDDSL